MHVDEARRVEVCEEVLEQGGTLAVAQRLDRVGLLLADVENRFARPWMLPEDRMKRMGQPVGKFRSTGNDGLRIALRVDDVSGAKIADASLQRFRELARGAHPVDETSASTTHRDLQTIERDHIDRILHERVVGVESEAPIAEDTVLTRIRDVLEAPPLVVLDQGRSEDFAQLDLRVGVERLVTKEQELVFVQSRL